MSVAVPSQPAYTHPNTVEWETPPDLFNRLDEEFGFDTDVCARPWNTKCAHYYTPEDDGLAQRWTGVCWMNPPYGREIGGWMRKAYEAPLNGATVVCLVPARTDTRWWWEYATKGEIRFIKGRIRFLGGEKKNPLSHNAPFPVAVVVFSPTRIKQSVWWDWRCPT